MVIDGEANNKPNISQKPKYKLPDSLKNHQRDFKTLSRQQLSEVVRCFDNTPYGNGKDYWAAQADKLGEWLDRFSK